jgi:hypothetical protein
MPAARACTGSSSEAPPSTRGAASTAACSIRNHPADGAPACSPHYAERALSVAAALIDRARYVQGVEHEISVACDERNVWYRTADGLLEERYTLGPGLRLDGPGPRAVRRDGPFASHANHRGSYVAGREHKALHSADTDLLPVSGYRDTAF